MPELLEKTDRIALQGGKLRLAVIADTHSNPHARTKELVAKERPDAILHAGDIGALSVLDDFATIAPVLAVRGNIDGRGLLPDVLAIDLEDDGESAFKLLLTHIAVDGPRLRADAKRLASAAGAQLVVCGHSHLPFIGSDHGVGIFNPGSCGPRRFRLPIVFGVIEIEAGQLAMKHIDCETGAPWAPARTSNTR